MHIEQLNKINTAMKAAWDSYNSFNLKSEQVLEEIDWLESYDRFIGTLGVTCDWTRNAIHFLKERYDAMVNHVV